jgi:hypothetical protein
MGFCIEFFPISDCTYLFLIELFHPKPRKSAGLKVFYTTVEYTPPWLPIVPLATPDCMPLHASWTFDESFRCVTRAPKGAKYHGAHVDTNCSIRTTAFD